MLHGCMQAGGAAQQLQRLQDYAVGVAGQLDDRHTAAGRELRLRLPLAVQAEHASTCQPRRDGLQLP
eukprot:349601-Chlamydomonas_euryale.AAC.4